jgi:hypoxanthine-DNA glycosylase
MEKVVHPWAPVFDARSIALILGTIPSPQSRARGFYYGHPQNAFWPTIARVFEGRAPEAGAPAAKRAAFLLGLRVAVWDVLHECEIDGASDVSIKNPVANRFRPIIERSRINAIFTTGWAATRLFERLCVDEAGLAPVYLPSTSPANRAAQSRPGYWERWALVREAVDGRDAS